VIEDEKRRRLRVFPASIPCVAYEASFACTPRLVRLPYYSYYHHVVAIGDADDTAADGTVAVVPNLVTG
jgi:hypothetical protein